MVSYRSRRRQKVGQHIQQGKLSSMPLEVPNPNQDRIVHSIHHKKVKDNHYTLRYKKFWSFSPASSIVMCSSSPLPRAKSRNSWRSGYIHGFRRWIWFFSSRKVDFGSTLCTNQPLFSLIRTNEKKETTLTVRVAIVFEPAVLTMTTCKLLTNEL